jgi:DNA-binding NtrC family response regulator
MNTCISKIFVVDDEYIICKTLTAILNRSGFDATGYSNPAAALHAMETLEPDLVISDISMPDMNGIELGIEINTKHPACKILLFSGQAATSSLLIEAGKQGHHFTVLTKPLHPRDLLAAIHKEMSITRIN